MAALWGGGAGHARAEGTLPLRGVLEPVVGSDLSSTQYLLAEDLRLASLDEAEELLEAEEFLGTVQDYLDSSVISIIEDFSSLTEQTKGRMDAENELSLLTAITEILDSTDDESLSPFDTIPDSELLTSPREHENSSFQRFLSLSVTPPEQDFHTTEDFQEPRICTIVTEKVEANTASLPCTLTQNCFNDSTPSKKPSIKAPQGDRRLFRHKERELPVSQRSDGEEEEEEEETVTGQGKGFVAGPKEILAVSATREVETDLATSDDAYVIAPESISLSELVRSMHPYCRPTFTVCLSAKSQPLAEELFAGPVVLGVVPDDEKTMEISVVLQNVEVEPPCRTDSSCTTGHVNREAVVLAPALEDVLPVNDTKIAGLDRELAIGSQAEGTQKATLQVVEDTHPRAEKEAQRPARDQESRCQLHPVAPINAKPRSSEKGQRCRRNKNKKNKSNKDIRGPKEATTCRLSSASIQNQSRKNSSDITPSSGIDFDFPGKQLEKPGRQDHDEPLPGQASQTKERMDTEMEELRSETELRLSSPTMSSLKSAEGLPPIDGHLSTQLQQCVDPMPGSSEQGNVQEPSKGSQPISLDNEMVSSEVSESLPSSTVDLAGQPPRSPFSTSSEEASRPLKEVKPKPLSLSEYRQRRQQRQPHDGSTKNTTEKQNASKWPSLPELPTELADLPCLVVPPPPTRVAVAKEPGLAKEPDGSSTTLAPVGKANAASPSMPANPSPPATIVPPSFPLGSVSTAPLTTPVPATSPLPNKVGAFPPVGAQVPPTLPPPYRQLNPRGFLSASPSSYILGSPPVPSWSHFAPLPTGYQNLPPPPAIEACPPVFHTIPPVPPPTWPPPPVSLPPFAPGLPFSSVEWAPGPQPSYWSGIPVPPPVLTIPYGDQGAHVQSPPGGAFPAPLSEGTLGQQSTALQNTAVALEPSCFQEQSLSIPEKSSLSAYQAQVPSAVRTGPRRVSDPRRKAQPSAAECKAEVTLGSCQPLRKSLSSPAVEILGKVALTQSTKKSSTPQSLDELPSMPPSQQAREFTGSLKSSEYPSLLPPLQSVGETLAHSGPVEMTIPAVAQSSKEAPSASCPQEKECPPVSAALVPEKLTVPTATERDVKNAAPTIPSALAAAPQKAPETGHLSKKLAQTWKHQPLISIAQRSCNKDIVQAFINEIGIEASDLSSLLEQFEKTEAKKEASSMAKSRENAAAKNDGSEVQQEKKTLDRLQAPELANVAGLTPPATPPHQLWKPLPAVSLLGKAGSPKGARLVKSLSKPHRKTVAPIHVGSGEHDYCQLSAVQPKEGSRWNVKHNLDITIKPIRTLTKEVPDHPGPNQTLAAVRLDAVGALSMTPACQNPKELPSPICAGQGQIQALSSAAASPSSPASQSLLPESGLRNSRTEPLDHRTSTPRSTPKGGSDDPCSVLLSPAASPCRDAEEPTLQQSQKLMQKRLASKRSLRCYRSRQKSASPQKGRWRGRRNRASRSFSSSSDGDSDSSSSRSRSRTRSPPSKCWRRYHSRSSSSSSCDSSWSRSRSRSQASSCSSYESRSSSRSPSLHKRSSSRRRYDSSSSHDRYQRQKTGYKESAIEERRVIFIGKIPSRMTRSELRHRFSVFGEIEDCTLHFRDHGDNYGFVTYRYAEEAFAAIEGGNAVRLPDEQPFDLCFGGRRQFCKRKYADLDSNREDFEPAPVKSKFDSLDFDTLLKQAQRRLRK